MDEDNSIKEINEQMKTITQTVQSLLDVLIKTQNRVDELSSQNKILKEYSENLKQQMDNMPYEWNDHRHSFSYLYPRIESHEETIRKICEEGMSLCRFGDGEYAIMQKHPRHDFQRMDERLAERLNEVIHSDVNGVIIAIADNFGDLSRFNENGLRGIRAYMTKEVREYLATLLDTDRVYADAYLTRFYAMLRDNKTDAPLQRLKLLRRMCGKTGMY